jgi:hypothetical protein
MFDLPIISVLTRWLNFKGDFITIAKLKPNIMSRFKVQDMIIHISTYSSSNEIQDFVVVLIPLQLTIGCILKRCRDDVPYLYNLPNSMSWAQQVVPCSVLSITEFFIIENHNGTFLHVTFESQSRLRTTSGLTFCNTN